MFYYSQIERFSFSIWAPNTNKQLDFLQHIIAYQVDKHRHLFLYSQLNDFIAPFPRQMILIVVSFVFIRVQPINNYITTLIKTL